MAIHLCDTGVTSTHTLDFGREKRLLTPSDYQAVFNDNHHKAAHPQLLFLARNNGLGYARLGLVVAKKHLRTAVERNQVKRLVREGFRLQQSKLGSVDVIFLARSGLDKLSKLEQRQLIHKNFRRLIKKTSGVTVDTPSGGPS